MNSFLYLRYLPGESPNTHSKLISTPPYVIYILVALSGSLARGTWRNSNSIDRALITCIKRDECYFGVTSANRRDFFLEKDYIGPTCAICYFSSVCIIYNFHSLFKKKTCLYQIIWKPRLGRDRLIFRQPDSSDDPIDRQPDSDVPSELWYECFTKTNGLLVNPQPLLKIFQYHNIEELRILIWTQILDIKIRLSAIKIH